MFADIISTEREERSMLEWMSTLPQHTFEGRHFESSEAEDTPLHRAQKAVDRERRVAVAAQEGKNEGEEPATATATAAASRTEDGENGAAESEKKMEVAADATEGAAAQKTSAAK